LELSLEDVDLGVFLLEATLVVFGGFLEAGLLAGAEALEGLLVLVELAVF
jgi:hypothetical protein